MKSYVSIYLKFFNYSGFEYVPCEICEYPAVDIMHIEPKGTNPHLKDDIFNLMAGCRSCHETSANEKERLKTIHLKFMLANQKERTEKLLDETINYL